MRTPRTLKVVRPITVDYRAFLLELNAWLEERGLGTFNHGLMFHNGNVAYVVTLPMTDVEAIEFKLVFGDE